MLSKYIFQCQKNPPKLKTIQTYYTVCPSALSPCFHGNSVSGSLMETSPWIWTFPHTSIYCAYTLFHFLTSAFFLTHGSTFYCPVYLAFLSLLCLLLSACLSLHLAQCKRLVSRQVLRPIKLSTSLVDLKDTNTKKTFGQLHRGSHTHIHAQWKTLTTTVACTQTSHPHMQAERPAVVHSLKLHFWKAASQADSFTQGLQTLLAMVS